MLLSFFLSKIRGKIAARSTTMDFDLLALPVELILLVMECLDNRKDISRLARTSKQMQEIAEPLLYRHILLKGPSALKQLETAIKRRPQRALAVQQLEAPSHVSRELGLAKVERLLMKLAGLREIMFESPHVNSMHYFETEGVWGVMTDMLFQPFYQAVLNASPATTPLQRLTKCTYRQRFRGLGHL